MSGRHGGPTVELLRTVDLSGEVLGAWRELAAAAVEPNPFFEPGFVLPAFGHLRGDREPRLLVVRHGRRLLACMPVGVARRWRKVPLPTVAGWRHEQCFLGTPLVAPDAVETASGALLDSLATRSRAPSLLVLEGTGTDGPVVSALLSAARERRLDPLWWDRSDRPALLAPPAPPPGAHDRLRRKGRALARHAGGTTVVDRSGDRSAVEAFLDLEQASWKGRAGTALASSAAGAAFFRDVCAAFAADGRLELLSLEGSGGPLAMRCVVRAGGTAFHLKSAFDERHGSCSPGALLLLDRTERFGEDGVGAHDSCADHDSPAYRHLWPDRIGVGTLLVPSGRVARSLVGGLASVRQRARRLRVAAGPGAAAAATPSRSPSSAAGRGTARTS